MRDAAAARSCRSARRELGAAGGGSRSFGASRAPTRVGGPTVPAATVSHRNAQIARRSCRLRRGTVPDLAQALAAGSAAVATTALSAPRSPTVAAAPPGPPADDRRQAAHRLDRLHGRRQDERRVRARAAPRAAVRRRRRRARAAARADDRRDVRAAGGAVVSQRGGRADPVGCSRLPSRACSRSEAAR